GDVVIRVFHVTGVQTCALPISGLSIGRSDPARDYRQATDELFQTTTPRADRLQPAGSSWQFARLRLQTCPSESGPGAVIRVPSRSEERRVGKSGGSTVDSCTCM